MKVLSNAFQTADEEIEVEQIACSTESDILRPE